MTENQADSPRRTIALGLATWLGSGLLPIAPGTWGSAATFPLFALLWHTPAGVYTVVTVTLLVAGCWAADEAERHWGQKDDRRIVIDEVVGQLTAWAPILALRGRIDFLTWAALVVTGFVAFRLLDIWKPGPARWAERNFAGGAGVVLDDVVAGIGAAIAVGIAVAAIAASGFAA